MKTNIINIAAISLLLAMLLILPLAYAEIQSPEEAIANQFGIAPEKLKNPEDLKNEYLKQEWSKIITNKPVIGSIHKFLLNNQLISKILFKIDYSFSLTFFATFILWLFFALGLSNVISSSGFIKGLPSFVIGAGLAIILAQVGLIGYIVNFALTLIFKREAWWMRWLVGLLVIVALIVIYQFEGIIGQKLKKSKEIEEKESMKQGLREAQAFVKGAKEGQRFKEKSGIQKLKDKFLGLYDDIKMSS